MKVNVEKIKSQLIKLNDNIEEYEKVYLNYYNELNNVSFAWDDLHSKLFFDNVGLEKADNEQFIVEMKKIRDVYKYLVEKYENLGNEIYFVLGNRRSVMKKFDSCISKLNSLINYYDDLDLSFCYDERQILLRHKSKLINTKNDMVELKSSFSKKIDNIEEIEKLIKIKLSKINIASIIKNDINNFI